MVDIKRFGEISLIICFEEKIAVTTHIKVKKTYGALQKMSKKGIVSLSPAYHSITVVFNPQVTNYKKLKEDIIHTIKALSFSIPSEKSVLQIPVCYDLALDMQEVCEYSGLEKEEVIKLHTSTDYLVYFSGFVPGFLYLGGLNEKLRVPRKKIPREKVNQGAVGLADLQTGIYPLETPGGWQIIGRTPLSMIKLLFNRPVQLGDFIQFHSITQGEFDSVREAQSLPTIIKKPWEE